MLNSLEKTGIIRYSSLKGRSTFIGGDYLTKVNKTIADKFYTYMQHEIRILGLKDVPDEILQPEFMFNVAIRTIEVAKNSTVLRVGACMGQLSNDDIAYESDGAHTNLVRAIVDWALDTIYGWGNPTPNHSRRIFNEAVLIHDLPENETGDTPDNGTRNEKEKRRMEKKYFNYLLQRYDTHRAVSISQLLEEMETKSTEDGRLLYVADKTAAIFMQLGYEACGIIPYALTTDTRITKSKINSKAAEICEIPYNNGHLLSEMFTVDYFIIRDLVQHDDSGFFTALLVMLTLIVHNKWYDWRIADYKL